MHAWAAVRPSEVELPLRAEGEIHHARERGRHERLDLHVHGLALDAAVHREQGLGPVGAEGQRLAPGARLREAHLLAPPVEGRVVVAEEGHAEDPDGAVLRHHVDLHEGGHAHVQLPDLRLEEEDVPEVVGLERGARDPHDVGLRGQLQRVPVHDEVQRGQVVHVRAVLLDLRDLFAQLHQRDARGGDERGAAVHDGRATSLGAAGDLRHAAVGQVEGHVVQAGDPVMLPDHLGRGDRCLTVAGAPGQEARRAGGLLQADGELRDAVGHEQGLLRVALAEVGPDAHDGRELRRVEDGDPVVDDFPEGLPGGEEPRPHGDGLIAQHGHAWPGAEDVLADRPVLEEGGALLVVVGRGGVHAVAAAGGTHEELEGACVEDARDLLAPDVEVGKVLHVLVVVQGLAEAGVPRRLLVLRGVRRLPRRAQETAAHGRVRGGQEGDEAAEALHGYVDKGVCWEG
mmetsp:Transcript_44129/g.137415  ORF Transcript_44129/g.137415 Transcript_44129/m.137415 type:complete len:457 (-) Transcript_44129:31-1401(-)